MDFSYVTFVFICLNAHFSGSLSYQSYKLESYKLCASKPIKKIYDFVHPPEIVLEDGGNSAVLINQTWNSTNISKLRSTCSFSVKSAYSDSKFFIVITKLKLRRIKDHCIDYIQFKDGGTLSDKICDDSLPIFGRRKDSFKIDVSVEKSIPIDDTLELEMLITAGGRCTDMSEQFQCNEEDDHSCISKRFVKDGRVNCFPPCRDEGTCSIGAISAQVADASSIALTAITSLVFTMVAVGTCVFLCWKYKDCLLTPGGINHTTEANIELPTAPPVDSTNSSEAQPRPPSPKDLPPSYESLFPERIPTTNPEPSPAS